MNVRYAFLIVFSLFCVQIIGANSSDQYPTFSDTLPYFKIPVYPEKYTAESTVVRMIDGAGFRFYWATEGLRPIDLAYKPTKEARSCEETIDHILGLTTVVINSMTNTINVRTGEETNPLDFDTKRRKVLENFEKASGLLKGGTIRLEDLKMKFKNGDQIREFPFWNQINGPISDALWHIGQVVSFRRSSGNPFNSKASVLLGELVN